MAPGERITRVDRLRSWTDQIPFHYEYTAGVAGERFLRGVKEGKILAAECPSCGKSYLPPKMYCVNCFVATEKYREVGPTGVVSAVTESHVGFDGRRLNKPQQFVFVRFKGVTGGLVQRGEGLRKGDRASARFRPESRRKGSLRDFDFVKAS
jgi:hypothetical protein